MFIDRARDRYLLIIPFLLSKLQNFFKELFNNSEERNRTFSKRMGYHLHGDDSTRDTFDVSRKSDNNTAVKPSSSNEASNNHNLIQDPASEKRGFSRHADMVLATVATLVAAIPTVAAHATEATKQFKLAKDLGGQALLKKEYGMLHYENPAEIDVWLKNVGKLSEQFDPYRFWVQKPNIEAGKQIVAEMANPRNAILNAAGDIIQNLGQAFAFGAAAHALCNIVEDVQHGKVWTVDNALRAAQVGAVVAPQFAVPVAVGRSVVTVSSHLGKEETLQQLTNAVDKIEYNQRTLDPEGIPKKLSDAKWIAVAGARNASQFANALKHFSSKTLQEFSQQNLQERALAFLSLPLLFVARGPALDTYHPITPAPIGAHQNPKNCTLATTSGHCTTYEKKRTMHQTMHPMHHVNTAHELDVLIKGMLTAQNIYKEKLDSKGFKGGAETILAFIDQRTDEELPPNLWEKLERLEKAAQALMDLGEQNVQASDVLAAIDLIKSKNFTRIPDIAFYYNIAELFEKTGFPPARE